MNRMLVFVAQALVAAALSTAALAGTAPRTPAIPTAGKLLPLSEADRERSHKTGCNFSFGGAKADYLQLIEDELVFRTPAGLQVCSIKNADAFMQTKGVAAVCYGYSLRLRSTGRTTHNEASDSSSGPATLSITQGRAVRTMHGSWGVAC